MDLMKISVVLYISFILILNKYSDCTTHPRVKMYGPKVTVIDRRKPETKVGPNVIDDVKIIPQPDNFLDEPSCFELRLMWRTYQRQNQLAQSANNIPMAFNPFAFSPWEDYLKPRYINRQKSLMFERTIPDRYHVYRQLSPFEKIARLTSTTRALMDDQITRKANLFRLGYPISKIPVISMRLTPKDRFQELRELLRHEKSKEYQTGDNDNEPYPMLPLTTVTSNDTAKKRPGYETLMSRPRHFSQGHYMNVKPSSEEIDENLSATVSPQVLIALHFFGTGSYQSPVGNSRFTSVSQPTVSRCVQEIVSALNNSEIFNKWIKFPSNMQELTEVRNGFYRKTKFPGVIGCIDCTHVAIVPPSANLNLNENQYPEHIYVNRKGYHSINVQLICDANLKVLNVNALFPGSTHDTHIWNNSNVLQLLKELHVHNYNDFYLLGDFGYPLRQWLLTPITNPNNEAEEYFNAKQIACRSIIERCNGVLKQRFRCLLKDRKLHYKPEKCTSIINACVVLHNICVSFKVPEINEEIGDMGMYQDHVAADLNHRNRDLILGRQQRDKIVRLFQHRY